MYEDKIDLEKKGEPARYNNYSLYNVPLAEVADKKEKYMFMK